MLSPPVLHATVREILTEERASLEPAVAMAASAEDGMHGKMCEIGDLSADRTAGMASSSRDGPVILQWGQRKRPRCSRTDNLKLSSLTDEPSVLLRKTVRVKAERVAPTEMIKAENGMRERHQIPPPSPELHAETLEGRKRPKLLRAGASELVKVCNGGPAKDYRGPLFHCHHIQNSHLPHLSKTRASPDRNTMSPYRNVNLTGGSIKPEAAKTEIDWPRFLITLSRKEKEDDFLMMKGSKLPQRPKRRPKIVERALHFCTPGNWLTDLSHGRYDVREKKCVKKKPRGLKAMESLDSDSE